MRLESNHPGGDQQRRAVLDPPLRPALRPSRSAAQDPPYGETTFNPTTPATIRPMHASRAGEALSANSTRPTVATPIAPIPEIGRASCRERVCSYVQIPRFAVSL